MFGLLKCRSVRGKLPGEQWSRRGTLEARGTKWNFDVEMDTGIPGPPLESRRDEGTRTATATATAPDPPPQLDSHEPEMRGQGVHATALRIRDFTSEVGRTPGCSACEIPGSGKSHTRECKTFQEAWSANELQRRRRRNAELLRIQIHDHWTRVRVQRIQSREGQKRPPWQTLKTRQTGWMMTTFKGHPQPLIRWNQMLKKTCRRKHEWQETFFTSVVRAN